MFINLRWRIVLLIIALLTGCAERQPVPAPIETVQPADEPSPPPEPPAPYQPLPDLPKLQLIDWHATLQPLLDTLAQTTSAQAAGVVLVERIKNSANGEMQSEKGSLAIYQALQRIPHLSPITPQQAEQARQAMGLSAADSLISLSKAIGLARYLRAQYLLFSEISSDVQAAQLKMQLMLVSSGEIIWSGQNQVKSH